MEIAAPTFDLLVVAPELVVLVTALLVMIVDLLMPHAQKRRLVWVALAGVVAAGAVSFYVWDGTDPTLHDMLAADGYALFVSLAILVAAALALLFSADYAERMGLPQGEYYTLFLLATAGMMLMAAAINLMTIFVALEILSLSLYALVGLNRAERRSSEAALKYFLLGAFATGFLAYGMALVYGQAGTTSLAGVRAHVLALDTVPALLSVGLGLMLVGLGFKVALVPFQWWTPDVYEGAPTPVTAFMSVGAKAAAFAALGRVVILAFGGEAGAPLALAVLAVLTMTVGNLAALRQTSVKRMLAYSSIAHAGYLLTGVAAGNEAGVTGVLFYLLAYAFMNAGAFAILVAATRFEGGSVKGETMDALQGLRRRQPWLAAAMAVFMLSLAGVPPLVGFLAKLYVFGAAVQAGLAWLAIAGVINSVISAYYYLRVVAAMYMREAPEGGRAEGLCPALAAGVGIAAVAVVVLGFWPAIIELARMAAAGLIGT
ncbi:MAG: NADH-quinone oxidoreductase subunit N [Anaerolineae bacterium]|nr:NADH-quinone oxidoreductase subunit N [Anaerolineae bacterium]